MDVSAKTTAVRHTGAREEPKRPSGALDSLGSRMILKSAQKSSSMQYGASRRSRKAPQTAPGLLHTAGDCKNLRFLRLWVRQSVYEAFTRQNEENQEYGLVLKVPKEAKDELDKMGPPERVQKDAPAKDGRRARCSMARHRGRQEV